MSREPCEVTECLREEIGIVTRELPSRCSQQRAAGPRVRAPRQPGLGSEILPGGHGRDMWGHRGWLGGVGGSGCWAHMSPRSECGF